ncbi:unnamed protein product [Phytomonas sp. EM1]|nr:unnamed protein product [Phytomonas sp. EM1]|eukprot:CCW64721.1 unnamed protein product [Phytomonas sp. isolate EM1]
MINAPYTASKLKPESLLFWVIINDRPEYGIGLYAFFSLIVTPVALSIYREGEGRGGGEEDNFFLSFRLLSFSFDHALLIVE